MNTLKATNTANCKDNSVQFSKLLYFDESMRELNKHFY